MVFSPDSARVATGSEDGTVKIWSTSTGKLITTLHVWRVKRLPRLRIVSRSLALPITIYISFSPDGRNLLTNLDWKTSPAKLWDTESGQLLATLGGHRESWGIGLGSGSGPAQIHKAMFSPDGKFIVTQSLSETRLWDAHTGSLKNTFSSYYDSARFSGDGKLLGVLKKDDNIGLIDVETGAVRIPLTSAEIFADQIVFSPNGQTAAVGGTLVDIPGRRVRSTIPVVYKRGRFILEPEDYVSDLDILSFHPNGGVLMAANQQFVRFWDMTTGQLIMKKDDTRTPAVFSLDGTLLARPEGTRRRPCSGR